MSLKALLIFVSIFLLIQTLQATAAESPTTKEPLSPGEQRLIDARRENEAAQAKYYAALTDKLNGPPSLRRSIAESPLLSVGLLISGLAALGGLLTLVVTSRANLRFHYDAQFFEAIKLFGDRDRVVRSSAAGVLGIIANRHVPTMAARIFSLPRTEQPYLGVAQNELLIGLAIETDPFTLLQIRRAVKGLSESQSEDLSIPLINANIRLQTGLRRALAIFFVANDATDAQDRMNTSLWEKVPRQNLFGREMLQGLVEIHKSEFENQFAESLTQDQSDPAKKKEGLAVAYHDLSLAIYRLYLIVDIFSFALKDLPTLKTVERNNPLFLANADLRGINLVGAKFEEVFLQSADLRGAWLQRANLEDAVLLKTDLRGALLDDAKIANARLAGAQIDTTTCILNFKWWTANYYTSNDTSEIDISLIKSLYERDKSNLPQDPTETHASVECFIRELSQKP